MRQKQPDKTVPSVHSDVRPVASLQLPPLRRLTDIDYHFKEGPKVDPVMRMAASFAARALCLQLPLHARRLFAMAEDTLAVALLSIATEYVVQRWDKYYPDGTSRSKYHQDGTLKGDVLAMLPKGLRWQDAMAEWYEHGVKQVDPEITETKDCYVLSEMGIPRFSMVQLRHPPLQMNTLHRMWREGGSPNPWQGLRDKLAAIDAERQAAYPWYRTRWLVAEIAAKLTRQIAFRPQRPRIIYASRWALGNRKRVATLQSKEAKEEAPRRKRGRPVKVFPHDHWFEGLTLATALQRNPMIELLKVAVINTWNPIKARESVSDALWQAVAKLRREPKKLSFESQEMFNTWLRAFVRNTVKRYQDDRWGDITRRGKENIIIASGLDAAYAELHALSACARGKKKEDMEAQDERACKSWRKNGPEAE